MFGHERFAPSTGMARRARARGMSIVEVMVGMVVALLVGLAATGAAISFSATQRIGIGAGGGVVNVGTALSSVAADLAAGGLGFFGDDAFMCGQLKLSVAAATVFDGAPFVPLRVTRGAVNDQIDVLYGNRVEAGANARIRVASNGTLVDLDNFLPAQVGDAVLLAPPPAAAGAPCLLRSVTAVTPAAAPAAQRLTFGAAGQHNQVVFSTANDYAVNSRVALVGRLNWSRYRLVGTDLLMERPLMGDSTVIARNVMTFRVQYGVSAAAAGSTTIESWQDADVAPWNALGAAEVRRVRALRLGVVTRSPVREKVNASNACESTAAMPTLFGAAVAADVADWQCFRFGTQVVVVPLRNAVMGAPT